MRRFKQLIAAILIVSGSNFVPASCNAQAAKAIGRLLGAEERAAGSAIGAAARMEGRAFGTSDEMLASLSEVERQSLRRAETDFMLASPPGTMVADVAAVARASALLREERQAGRSVAPFADVPHLRVRLTSDQLLDDVVVRMSTARLEPLLRQRLDHDRLQVVTLAMADDARVSLREMERTAALIGRSRVDKVGPLARIGDWAGATQTEMASILRPYKGRTVVLIGHLPPGSRSFFVYGPGGRRVDIDIEGLIAAAEEAGVNLIPLGCRSGEVARIGLAADINSVLLARRLRDALSREPRTMGEFLREFTSQDIEILVDAMNVRLFSDGFSLINRRSGAELARMLLRIAPHARARGVQVAFDRCFSLQTVAAFRTCATQLATQETTLFEQLRNKIAERHRRDGLASMAGRLREAERAIESGKEDWARYTLLYCVAIVPLWLYFYHVMTGAAYAESEGEPMRRWFLREYVLWSARSPRFIFTELAESWRFIIVLAGSVVFLVVPFGASRDWMWGEMYLGAGIGLSINFALSAVVGRSWAPIAAIPAIGLAAAAAGLYARQGSSLDEKQFDVWMLLQERADLQSDSPNADWRQVWDWELENDPSAGPNP